jgi:type II secretory pathway pseudopilin PulG
MFSRHKSGFGIIEVMVAVAIVVTVGGALFAVARNASKTIMMTQDQITAANLAQGLLERARGIRDKAPNVLQDQAIFQPRLNAVTLDGTVSTANSHSITVNNVEYSYALKLVDNRCEYENNNRANNTIPVTGIGYYCKVYAQITWINPQSGTQTYQASELLTDWR